MIVVLELFPHAGGMAHQYAPLSRRLRGLCAGYGAEVDIRVADYRADGPARDVQQIARSCAEELARGDGPVVLAGHSLGAFVAYETALLLAPTSGTLSLVVSGQVAPQLHRGGSLHLASDEALVEELTRVDGGNRELFADAQMRSAFLPSIRDDYRLVETYTPSEPGAPLQRIVAVKGDRDGELDVHTMALWRRHARQRCGPIIVPGSHMHHLNPRGHLAEILTGEVFRCLTRPVPETA